MGEEETKAQGQEFLEDVTMGTHIMAFPIRSSQIIKCMDATAFIENKIFSACSVRHFKCEFRSAV